jgi:hypothetical protein
VALHSAHNTPYKLKPAAAEDVEQLNQHEYDSALSPRAANNPRDCSVCKEDVEEGAVIIRLPRCAHVFHADCLKKWLMYQNWCPVCRTEVGSATSQLQEEADDPCAVHKGSPLPMSKVTGGACLEDLPDDGVSAGSDRVNSLSCRTREAGVDDSGEERKDRH